MSRVWYELYCKYLNSKCVIFDVKNICFGKKFESIKKVLTKKFETNPFSNYKTIESSKGSISTHEQNGFCRC